MDHAQHLATSRHNLTDAAYQSDRHLAARQRLYDHQKPAWNLPVLASGLIASHKPRDILDIGCGNGTYLEQLRNDFPDATVIAADLSDSIMHDLENPKVVADVQALPFADDSFDAIMAMHMLYHVPDIPQAISELARTCQSEGIAVISTHSTEDKKEITSLWAKASALINAQPISDNTSLLWPLRFNLDNAPDLLRESFGDVQSADMRSRITLTDAAPLIAHLKSMRSFFAISDAEFAETLDTARMLAEGHIAERGSFLIHTHIGFVVGRQPQLG